MNGFVFYASSIYEQMFGDLLPNLGEGYITNAKKINRDKSNSVTGTSFNTQTQLLHKFASVSCAPFLYYTLTLTLIAYS